MNTKSIEEFCRIHHACREGSEWALDNCKDMRQVWEAARPDWLVWIATRPGVLTDNELRRFAIFSARSVEHLLTDERSRHAIDMAEKFLDGKASAKELEAASAGAAPLDAARAAAWAARAAGDRGQAADAAWATAWAARRAARAAAAADTAAQAAEWLRANTNPTF